MDYEGQPCKTCGDVITVYSLSGLCRQCWHSRTKQKRYCSSCQKPISPYNKSGLCFVCRRGQRRNLDRYYFISVNGKQILEHRYVWEQAHSNKLPKGWVIHHLNGLKGDNRPENLFAMSRREHNSHLVELALQDRIRQLERQLAIN